MVHQVSQILFWFKHIYFQNVYMYNTYKNTTVGLEQKHKSLFSSIPILKNIQNLQPYCINFICGLSDYHNMTATIFKETNISNKDRH